MSNSKEKKRSSPAEIKPQDQPQNPKLAELVRKSRANAGLRQSELASRAGVSPKTVAKLEEQGIARWDAIARVAHALTEPINEWLRIAGLSVRQSRVDDILSVKTHVASFPFQRLDPAKYYDRMERRLQKHHSALMCVFILSNFSVDNPKLSAQVRRVIGAGLHMALISPFPLANPKIAATKPSLNQYYSTSYTWTCELAKRMRMIHPDGKDRVHVFTPRTLDSGAILVATPLRLTEHRPCVTKYSQEGDLREICEFGAYIHYMDNRPDQWIDIFDGESAMNERTKESFNPWYDLVSDVLTAWSSENGKSKYDLDALENGFWRLMPV